MTTFAIVSSVPLSGVIAMPALGMFLMWLAFGILAATAVALVPLMFAARRTRPSNTRDRSGMIGFGSGLAHTKA